jgi:hypothetical protein
MKSKVSSSKGLNGAKGGNGHMFGKSGVAPSKSGVSATPTKQVFSKAAPKGGKGHMFAKSGSRAAPAGGPPLSKPGAGTGGNFSVSGGKGRMAGHSGASPAKAR